MDSDDVLTAPEELARLRPVHLHLSPDRNLRIDDRKELVKIGDLPVDDGIHPEDFSQFLGGGFVDLFGIRQIRLCQQVVDLRDLHVFEGKGAEVVVKTPAYGFEPQFALGLIPEGENRHRQRPVFLHIGIDLVRPLEHGDDFGGDDGRLCRNHAAADQDRQQQDEQRRRLFLPERFHGKPPEESSIARNGMNGSNTHSRFGTGCTIDQPLPGKTRMPVRR